MHHEKKCHITCQPVELVSEDTRQRVRPKLRWLGKTKTDLKEVFVELEDTKEHGRSLINNNRNSFDRAPFSKFNAVTPTEG